MTTGSFFKFECWINTIWCESLTSPSSLSRKSRYFVKRHEAGEKLQRKIIDGTPFVLRFIFGLRLTFASQFTREKNSNK